LHFQNIDGLSLKWADFWEEVCVLVHILLTFRSDLYIILFCLLFPYEMLGSEEQVC